MTRVHRFFALACALMAVVCLVDFALTGHAVILLAFTMNLAGAYFNYLYGWRL